MRKNSFPDEKEAKSVVSGQAGKRGSKCSTGLPIEHLVESGSLEERLYAILMKCLDSRCSRIGTTFVASNVLNGEDNGNYLLVCCEDYVT